MLDRIVAVVNNEVITRADLAERTRFAAMQLKQQGTPPPPREVLERQILERLITDRVQLQHAKETGLRVDDPSSTAPSSASPRRTSSRVQAAARGAGKRRRAFPRFREDIRNEILLSRLREREVDNRIVVTEGEIDNLHQRAAGANRARRGVQPLAHPGDGPGERQPGADPGPPRPRRAGARSN